MPFLDNDRCRPWRFPELVERARSLDLSPGVAESLSALTVKHSLNTFDWLATPEPAYKRAAVHWLNWREPAYR